MKRPIISIVLPCFNVSEYLGRSLSDLCAQSLHQIEVLVVNDGSTDDTLDIADKYARRDDRIVVINKANGGCASARNEGLRHASGIFILFMDPDDSIEKNALEICNGIAVRDNAEIVMFNHDDYFESSENTRIRSIKGLNFTTTCNQEIKEKFEQLYKSMYINQPWNKLFRRDFLIQNNAKFCENISVSEDIIFNYSLISKAERISVIPDTLYHYVHRDSGLSGGYKKWHLNNRIYGYKEVKRILTRWNPNQLGLATDLLLTDLFASLANLITCSDLAKEEKHHEISKIVADTTVREACKDFSMLSFRNRVLRRTLKSQSVYLVMLLFRLIDKVKRIRDCISGQ